MTSACAPPWELLLRSLPAPVAVADAAGHVLARSEEFDRLVDDAQSAALVRHAEELLPAGAGPAVEREDVVRSRTGSDLRCRVRRVQDDGGGDGWLLLHVEDPDSRARDPLTGLLGRDAFVERLREAVAHAQRHGGVVEVVVLDVDSFKAVNDRHGHLAGDEVLVEVAQRLQRLARSEDTVCRWGGDEFVLLLVGDTPSGGERLCRRVAGAMSEPFLLSRGPVLRVTASCGAVRTRAGDDPVEVMHRADLLMYERKRQHHARHGTSGELGERLARARARAEALRLALDETTRRRWTAGS